ncbi:MAG: hypothetical protein J8272_00525 ['Prunus persica' phytoplasma PP2]|nr:hypothetical protein ['Prunus persica' phytoplasma PP2]
MERSITAEAISSSSPALFTLSLSLSLSHRLPIQVSCSTRRMYSSHMQACLGVALVL